MNGDIMAVSWSEFKESGCVKCGCEYCYTGSVSGGGCSPVTCGECGKGFVILADGLTKSRIGFGSSDDSPAFYPELQTHPRRGIPSHEYVRPDVRPDVGEYWSPRGVGYDLSGFVKSKDAGERIVKMVENVIGKAPNSWLDHRPLEPNWIQVKVQANDGFNLEKLRGLCSEDCIITEDRLRQALVTIEPLVKDIANEPHPDGGDQG